MNDTQYDASTNGAPVTPCRRLLARFDQAWPRYTSYPTPNHYAGDYDAARHKAALAARAGGGPFRPLSLYVHIPFCESVCYYCACTHAVQHGADQIARYLAALRVEADMVRNALTGATPLTQLYLGGGVPTSIDDTTLHGLVYMLESMFAFAPDAQRLIEVDPHTIGLDRLRALRNMDFNRISFGIQDFSIHRQNAAQRAESSRHLFNVAQQARSVGFDSINIDLIYCLPHQTVSAFADVIDTVVKLAPNRITLHAYGHLPDRYKPRLQVHEADLPDVDVRVGMLHLAIERLTTAGWRHIGMNHFARPDDGLARAKREGRLHRGFQGYTGQPEGDLIALGVSAMSRIGTSYVQNVLMLDAYCSALENGRAPIMRGHAMTADDLIRRAVIMAIVCQGDVSYQAIEESHLIDFRRYFRSELEHLNVFADAGLVHYDTDGFRVSPLGWFVVAAIASVFDRYHQAKAAASPAASQTRQPGLARIGASSAPHPALAGNLPNSP